MVCGRRVNLNLVQPGEGRIRVFTRMQLFASFQDTDITPDTCDAGSGDSSPVPRADHHYRIVFAHPIGRLR